MRRGWVMDPSSPLLDAGTRAGGPATPRATVPAPEDRDHPTLRSALNEPSSALRFADFLDVINPLQHIPIVSSIYRAITGDEIAGPARVLGGALFGGPLGFVAGIVDAITAQANGADFGAIAIAALVGEEDAGPAVAQGPGDAAPRGAVVAGAVEGAGGAPLLTGEAAFQALAADLGVAGPGDTALLPPDTSAAAARRRVATVDTDRPLAPPPLSAFTAQMLDGLDKYKALAAARASEQAAVHRRLDETL